MATSDLRKAAVLLKSLSEEQAAALLGKLEPRQAAAVTAEAEAMGEIDAQERESVTRELAEASARQTARRAMPEPAPFAFLHKLNAEQVLRLLTGERPQTVAMVLACLPPSQSVAVLDLLPPDQRLTVICRIAAMREPDVEAIYDVEQGLRRRLFGTGHLSAGRRGLASVVRMLNAMEPATERKLLRDLGAAAPELFREIRRAMFGVSDGPMIAAVTTEHAQGASIPSTPQVSVG